MGVMECSRKGCENILCGMYSSEYGYICGECFEELVKLGPSSDIGAFMARAKEPDFGIDLEELARKRLDAIFR